MTFTIPYLYDRKLFGCFSFGSINEGVKLCRQLGWEPIGIILGKIEKEDCRGMAHCGAGSQGIRGAQVSLRRLGMPIVRFSKAESEFSFLCDSENKFKIKLISNKA